MNTKKTRRTNLNVIFKFPGDRLVVQYITPLYYIENTSFLPYQNIKQTKNRR